MGDLVFLAVPSLVASAFVLTVLLMALPAASRGPSRRAFAVLALAAFAYLLGDGLARLAAAADLPAAASAWNLVHGVGATFLPPAFLLLAGSLHKPSDARWVEPLTAAALGLGGAFAVAQVATPLVVVETRVVGGLVAFVPGEAYGLYLAFLFAVLSAALAAFAAAARGAPLPRTRREAGVGVASCALTLGAGAAHLVIAPPGFPVALDPVALVLPVSVFLVLVALIQRDAPATTFQAIRAILHSLQDAVLIAGPASTVTFANEAARRLLSSPARTVEGALVPAVLRAPAFGAEAHARLAGAYDEVASGGSDRLELVLETQEPHRRRLATVISATTVGEGEREARPRPRRAWGARYVFLLFRDETEMREKEAQLSKANEAKDLFISMFGHDLKSPLAAITGYSELVSLDAQSSADAMAVYQYSLQIRDAAAQIQLMMENARVFSRMLDARPDEGLRERIDIPAVVRREVANLRRAAERSGVACSVAVEGPEEELTVMAAPVLRNAFQNLLDNAIKYSPPGGAVTVAVRTYGEVVEVEVADEGPGVPQDKHEAVFRKFTRLDQTRKKAEGIGIGLSIVRGIVQFHGGTVSVQGRADGTPGAVFVVRLPKRPA